MRQGLYFSKTIAIILSVVMVFSIAQITAYAAQPPDKTEREIIAFELLDGDMEIQTVPFETTLGELNLPESLYATVRFTSVAELDLDVPPDDIYELEIEMIDTSKDYTE